MALNVYVYPYLGWIKNSINFLLVLNGKGSYDELQTAWCLENKQKLSLVVKELVQDEKQIMK